jgi:hypothetical protein
MPLELSLDCTFTGPALPEPFVKFNLEAELNKRGLLPKSTGQDGRALAERWQFVRRKLGALVSHGGGVRVQNHVIEPLLPLLGYGRIEAADDVQTREGIESGGALLVTEDGTSRLRVWCVDLDADLDAPARRGEAYRFSHTRIAQRVLLASGERLALLTNGNELRLLISDPARVDSQVAVSLDPHWKRSRDIPDSFRLVLALASPAGAKALPDIIDQARLQQAKVTKDLREQARTAIREFIQELIDHPENQAALASFTDRNALAKALWHEGLITVYRLLFILKLESTDDPARSFSFASTSLWRNTFSPSVALAPIVRRVLDQGAQTGRLLQDGLRALFRMLSDGLQCTELNVRPMAGALFSPATTPILGRLLWSETAIAKLLDNLLWTRTGRGATARERVHYGPLDVEDLGRVYEALLELEPGISAEPMCRLRRAKLEVVVPAAQGERYKPAETVAVTSPEGFELAGEEPETEEEEDSERGSKTKVEWIEEIPAQRFYLRVGLGRKATGSFYTPHSFVRFLVQQTLGPLVMRASSADDPQPSAILRLKIVDKAMGSGHFLVEGCRFLGEALYEAARRCDELAATAEKLAESYRISGHTDQTAEQESRVATFRQRVIELPDPEDELLRYLPSRSVEGTASGVSHNKALALCRRMVAVHCLYGVDKNPLAVELAKLALWIECHAEGLPLTFLDHRLVAGDSLTGPFFEHLLRYPGTQTPLDDLFTRGLREKLTATLGIALAEIRALESNVGLNTNDDLAKRASKARLDSALAPFRLLAAAWSGGVMLGAGVCDDTGYATLARTVAESGELHATLDERATPLRAMVAMGLGLREFPVCATRDEVLAQLNSPDCNPAFSYDIGFPEVFYPTGDTSNRRGFDADLGNPPWDRIEVPEEEFWANYDLEVLSVDDKKAREPIIAAIAQRLPESGVKWAQFIEAVEAQFRLHDVFYKWQAVVLDGRKTTGRPDLYRLFAERACQVLVQGGLAGCVYPSSIHANEGATGIRQLYLDHNTLRCCYSFENRRKLFEIDSRVKFAAVVISTGGVTTQFDCAFYLHDDSWLFAGERNPPALIYTVDFVRRTGGRLLSFVECRRQVDADLLSVLHSGSVVSLGALLEQRGMEIAFGVELHRNRDFNLPLQPPRFASDLCSRRLTEPPQMVPVVEGKAFNQFTDKGEYPVDVCSPLSVVLGKPKWYPALAYYRLAYREVASSTNERTLICTTLTPGVITNHKAGVETKPFARTNGFALALSAVLNSFFADWQVRQKVASSVSAFIFRATKIPATLEARSFLAHAALRLTANHAGYEPLWREQLGEAWRETGPAWTRPALEGDSARWAVRAAVDAVVAAAYGLTREQYAHVLTTFSHSSFREAPRLCLAAFDELQRDGLEPFTRRHDPYHDIPLNEALPQPVIELPLPTTAETAPQPRTGELFAFETQPAPAGSGVLFTEQPVARKRKKGTKP